jgi:hypothetical protein
MDNVLDAEALTKRYGATIALDELTLSVAPGEVFGFLGPNGNSTGGTCSVFRRRRHPNPDPSTPARSGCLGRRSWVRTTDGLCSDAESGVMMVVWVLRSCVTR